MLDVLVIAPHPDDAELGMGGAIVSLMKSGFNVGVLDLTDGEPTPHGNPEIRANETAAASAQLALEWRENLGLKNRYLEPTIDARRQLACVLRRERPRWLFAPYWVDAHPDHVAATQLVEAARFWAKLTKSDMPGEPHHPERIYYYFCVHLNIIPQPAFVLDITPYWDRKLAAIRCFESQFIMGRSTDAPTFLDKVRDEAEFWGSKIGTQFGEPFAAREPLGIQSVRDFI